MQFQPKIAIYSYDLPQKFGVCFFSRVLFCCCFYFWLCVYIFSWLVWSLGFVETPYDTTTDAQLKATVENWIYLASRLLHSLSMCAWMMSVREIYIHTIHYVERLALRLQYSTDFMGVCVIAAVTFAYFDNSYVKRRMASFSLFSISATKQRICLLSYGFFFRKFSK